MKKDSANQQLLNIKQAAGLLNVSEISLRRWTDSGRLRCYRLGGRRERRFQRDDLLAFMEGSKGREADVSAAPPGAAAGVTIEGLPVAYGNHLCSLYETDLGRIKLSVPFLVEGLRSGDRCFLIAGSQAQAHILEHVASVYADLQQALASGRLVPCDGRSTGQEMLDFLESRFVLATRSGSQNLRVLGDMAWAIASGISMAELMQFEMHYNHSLARRFAVVSLCQYDTREFAGTTILNALRQHEDTFKFPLNRFIGL